MLEVLEIFLRQPTDTMVAWDKGSISAFCAAEPDIHRGHLLWLCCPIFHPHPVRAIPPRSPTRGILRCSPIIRPLPNIRPHIVKTIDARRGGASQSRSSAPVQSSAVVLGRYKTAVTEAVGSVWSWPRRVWIGLSRLKRRRGNPTKFCVSCEDPFFVCW